MAAGVTYEKIASTTLGSAAASVTFSSIPSTYTDLVLVIVGANAGGSRVRYQFNSDSGSNYSRTNIVGTGSSAASYSGSNNTVADLNVIGGATALTAPYTIITNFQNYSNTTTYKTLITRFGSNDGAAPAVEAIVNLWRSTSAINRIDTTALGGNFVTGSTFNLYGIAAA
jgi:hypothetical protein